MSKKTLRLRDARQSVLDAAREVMQQFFQDKVHYLTNQPIPPARLLTQNNIEIVANADDLGYALRLANDGVEQHYQCGKRLKTNHRTHAGLNLWFIQECRRLHIPVQFQGGLLLLYLWLCEGVSFVEEKAICA